MMISWIIDNKEWVFSGIGVLVLSLIIGAIINRKAKTSEEHKSVIKQKQKAGKNSSNIQIGSVHIGDSIGGSNNNGHAETKQWG